MQTLNISKSCKNWPWMTGLTFCKSGCSKLFWPVFLLKANLRRTTPLGHQPLLSHATNLFIWPHFSQVSSCHTLCWFVNYTFQGWILISLSRKSSKYSRKKGKFRARLVLLLQQSNWIDRIAGIALKSIEKILRERGKLLSKKYFNYSVFGFSKKTIISFKLFYFRVF